MTLLPNDGGDITLTFTDTDGNTATKTATLKSAFSAGTIKNLGTVKNLTWESKKYYFVPVYEAAAGTYMFVSFYDDKYLAAKPIVPTDTKWYGYPAKDDVTSYLSSGYLVMDSLDDAYIIAGSTGNFTIQQSYNSYYWSQDSGYNTVTVGEASSAGKYSITFFDDGTAKILNNDANKYLQYSTEYTSFGSYSDENGIAPVLYKLVEDPADIEAQVTLTTKAASSVASTTAVLNASYSGLSPLNATEVGFYYGTSATVLDKEVFVNDAFTTPSGTISATLISLEPNTTYYYKVTMQVWDPASNSYKTFTGDVMSFTTKDVSQVTSPGYLSCYEMPDVSAILSGESTEGNNSGRDDIWYRYYTNNAKRQIAVHTFTHPTLNETVRNYTVLYDGDNYAPLWTAHAMHSSMWVDKNVGRSGSWTADPAISLTQQSGLDNASSVGYSRGHLVSSNERQSSTGQNAQTFYYSNQAPQWQNSFNGSIWSAMEQDIVDNSPSGRDTLYVVTGVLYEGTITTLPSGSYNVPIPSHFYKCLMECEFDTSGNMTSAKGIAYVYTNEAHSGNYYDSEYVKTIDAVEARAGFDFFANVPSSLQNSAEATATALWSY